MFVLPVPVAVGRSPRWGSLRRSRELRLGPSSPLAFASSLATCINVSSPPPQQFVFFSDTVHSV